MSTMKPNRNTGYMLVTIALLIVFCWSMTQPVHAATDEESHVAAHTAEQWICGNHFVKNDDTILGSKLLQDARVNAWVVYKDASNLRGKYVFTAAFEDTKQFLNTLTPAYLSQFCEDTFR